MGEIFITRRSGMVIVPSIFGNGSDGDAAISGTVTLPVLVPHQSIIEKQFKSLTINPGAILKAAAHNAGLIIRVQGDCTIHGTIDQSGLAPKTNPQNTYPYPAQLVCGDGGNGDDGARGYFYGKGYSPGGTGGTKMLKRPYGGGYGGGGGGGGNANTDTSPGGNGGGSAGITVNIPNIFIGGETSSGSGLYGGGGGSSSVAGGNGAGVNGTNANNSSIAAQSGGGGGAGNYGGGVILLYVGGNILIDGKIACNGLSGGSGGSGGIGNNYPDRYYGGSGGYGGGGGGGAIYILHRGTYMNTGVLQINGGSGINAGGVGSITVIQHTN